MKLSDVIKIWDVLTLDGKEFNYNDFELAVDATVGIEDDIFINMDIADNDKVICPYCYSDITSFVNDTKIDLGLNVTYVLSNPYETICPMCDGKMLIHNHMQIHRTYEVTPIFEEESK